MAHLDSEHRAEAVSAGAMLRELAETQRNPAPGQGQEPAGPDTSHEPSCTVPVLRWHTLRPDRYRAALKAGELECGIYVGEQWHRGKPTVVFIHGAAGFWGSVFISFLGACLCIALVRAVSPPPHRV